MPRKALRKREKHVKGSRADRNKGSKLPLAPENKWLLEQLLRDGPVALPTLSNKSENNLPVYTRPLNEYRTIVIDRFGLFTPNCTHIYQGGNGKNALLSGAVDQVDYPLVALLPYEQTRITDRITADEFFEAGRAMLEINPGLSNARSTQRAHPTFPQELKDQQRVHKHATLCFGSRVCVLNRPLL